MQALKTPLTHLALVLVASALTACTIVKSQIEAAPLVNVEQGRLSGKRTQDPQIALFAGIPFAAPPVGDLRWAPPRAPLAWEGVRPAHDFGNMCMQAQAKGGSFFVRSIVSGMGLEAGEKKAILDAMSKSPLAPVSEDCLYLNIRTGNLPLGRFKSKSLQPVMVWIHGGGHTAGSGSTPTYQSSALTRRGVVNVAINYRLGAFGYLAHPALSADSPHGVSGNYGLLDQIAALKWVRANIASFGGDPDNITIFGESAGGQSVSELMATPMAKGLFHKGILQSGVSSSNMLKLKQTNNGTLAQQDAGAAFLAGTGLAPINADAKTLRAIRADDIQAASAKARQYGSVFLPVTDGHVLPTTIGLAIAEGRINDVPTLIGYNADEGSLFYQWTRAPMIPRARLPKSHDERMNAIRAFYGQSGDEIIKAYSLDAPENRGPGNRAQAEAHMLGDNMFGVHARFLAAEQSARGTPAYFYHFTRTPPSPRQTIGAYHAAEIAFVFDTHSLGGADSLADQGLTRAMGDYWANFAKSGNPNGKDLPAWPTYNAKDDNWLLLGHEIKITKGPRRQKLDALEVHLRKQIATSQDSK